MPTPSAAWWHRLRERGAPSVSSTAMIFSAMWLVYLGGPMLTAWRDRDSARGLIGMGATLLFAGAYLWHYARSRRRAWGAVAGEELLPEEAQHRRYVRYAVLVALAAVVTWAVGQDGTTTWIFVAISGLWTFGFAVAIGIALLVLITYEICAYQIPGWERDATVGLAIALGVVAVGVGMIASRRQRDLSAARRENARLMVEDERNRMARDLHDILGHSLTVITVKAELAGRLMDVAPDRAKAEIEALEMLAREALTDVRRAVEGFREISLVGELARAREALTSAGIEPRLPRAVEGVPTDLRELYAWGVREGVTNVIRHSGATSCTITIDHNGLRIVDDGVGASAPGGSGNGLRGLRERAAAVGATLTTQTRPRGFEVQIFAPNIELAARPNEPVATEESAVVP